MEVDKQMEQRRKGSKKPTTQAVSVSFPEDEEFVYGVGRQQESGEDGEATSAAAQDPQSPSDTEAGDDLKNLRFLGQFVSSPSHKRRLWLWKKMLPGVVFSKSASEAKEVPKEGNQLFLISAS